MGGERGRKWSEREKGQREQREDKPSLFVATRAYLAVAG